MSTALEVERTLGEKIIDRAHALGRCPLCLEPAPYIEIHLTTCTTIVPEVEADRILTELEAPTP